MKEETKKINIIKEKRVLKKEEDLKQKKIVQEVKNTIKKKHKENIFRGNIPTGADLLDLVLGGSFPYGAINIVGDSSSGKCISGAFLLTENGFENIDDIGSSFPEGISSFNKKLIWDRKTKQKCSHFYKETVNKIVEIQTENGFNLKGTPEHPLFVFKKEKNGTYNDSLQKSKLSQIRRDDFVLMKGGTECYGKRKKHITINNKGEQITKKIDKNMASLLALFLLYGSLSLKDEVLFLCANDHICKMWTKVISSVFNKKGNNNTYSVRMYDKEIISFIKEIFYSSYGIKQCEIPSCILQSSKKIQVHFLRTLFATIKKDLLLSIDTKLKQQIGILLLNMGLFFNDVPQGLFKKTLCLRRKKSFYFLEKVKTISTLYSISGEIVYDVCVPKKHVFYANGFVNHNSFLSGEIIANAYHKYGKNKLEWFYDNAEKGYTVNSKKLYGIDILNGGFFTQKRRSNTIEDFEKNIAKIIKEKDPDKMFIYVLDSFDSISSEDEIEYRKKRQKVKLQNKEDNNETEATGTNKGTYNLKKQKETHALFRTIIRDVVENKILLIVVSQVKEKINSFFKQYYRTGGKALDFYPSVVFWLAEVFKYTKKNLTVGICVKVFGKKTRSEYPFRSCYVDLLFDYGIDNISSNIKYLYDIKTNEGKDKKNVFGKTGLKWDNNVFFDFEQFISFIEENNLEEELKNRVVEKWTTIEEEISSKNRKNKWRSL